MPIQAVFFDLGGTLFSYGSLRNVFGEALSGVAAEHGLDVTTDDVRHAYQVSVMTVMAEYKDRPYYLHRDLFNDAHRRMLERLGASPDAGAGSALATGPEGMGLDRIVAREGTAAMLEELRAAGLHLGIVSNIDDDQFDAIWSHIGLAHCFDATTTSEAARSCKPDVGIFEVALAKAGVAAEAVAFVGDSIHADIGGANAVGMRSIWLSDTPPTPDDPVPDHVIQDLREIPGLLLG